MEDEDYSIIAVSKETKQQLRKIGTEGETFDALIKRLIRSHKHWMSHFHDPFADKYSITSLVRQVLQTRYPKSE